MKLSFCFLFICLFLNHSSKGQWTIKNLDESSQNAGCVKFKHDSLGLFMGQGSSVLKSTDVGETWRSIDLNIDINIYDFQFIGDSSVFAVGDYYHSIDDKMTSKLIKSNNLGDSWDLITDFPDNQIYSLCFFNNDTGIVIGYDQILKTIDAGSSWDIVWSIKDFGFKYGELTQLSFPSKQVGYVVGIGRNQYNNPGFNHFILKSIDSGSTWNLIDSFPSNPTCLHFINQDIGFVGTKSGNAYKTINGGETWNEIQIANDGEAINSFQFISDTVGYAVGGITYMTPEFWSSYFFISKTTDGGNTWSSYDTLGIPLNSITFINDTIGFVSGNYRLIMKLNGNFDKLPDNYPWHLVQSVGINDLEISKSEIKIYPNPTDGDLFIKSTDSNNTFESLSIMSISGNNIKTIKYFNGETAQLNLSDLKSGVYLIELISKDKKEQMKIIKK